VYCSRECQKAHWKANHKQRCIAKADRAPQTYAYREAISDAASSAEIAGKKCAICLNSLTHASTYTLPCTHEFHTACVEELSVWGINQACPLCRTPLPNEAENICEDATRLYVKIGRLVERGAATWSNLPPSAQRELDAAIVVWQTAAEDFGLSQAQLNLGIVFQHGHGVVQSDAKALHWYRQAADQGCSRAQLNMGLTYRDGRGVAQSDVEAARWFRKAADQGHLDAENILGLLNLKGLGVAKNEEEAARWFMKAAGKGSSSAQLALGGLYKSG